MFQLILITVIVVYVFKYFLCKSVPGPVGLPIVGYYPFIGSQPDLTILRLAKKYGPIMKVNILNEDYYFLNNVETVTEAFVHQADCFSGRAIGEFNVISFLVSEKAVSTSEGNWHNVQQKFILRKLSQLGMGKSEYECKMNELCFKMVDLITSTEGKDTDFLDIFMNYTSNVLCTLMYSKNYAVDDPEYIPLRNFLQQLFIAENDILQLQAGKLFGFLFRRNKNNFNYLTSFKQQFYSYMNAIYKEREISGSIDEYDDLLSAYLKEANASNAQFFTEETVTNNFIALFTAGTLSSATTLYHLFYLMATNADIQKKVHEEIDSSLGKNETVSLRDRNLFHFIQAVISETHRFCGFANFSLLHVNKNETQVAGYKIPKRSKVFANIRAIARDARYFDKTEMFNPYHFLGSDGKYVKSEANIPFSTGKRKCLGEKLAECEIFIAFVILMQRFSWDINEIEAKSVDITFIGSRYALKACPRNPSYYN